MDFETMEIGSEYWKKKKQYIGDEETVYLCGRTALDVIIKDAVQNYNIKRVLLPSYCCHTMIEPFFRNNVEVRFYDVYEDEGVLVADMPEPRPYEMLYLMKYFGDTDILRVWCREKISAWQVRVEDLTHSYFNKEYKSQADYWFTSFRKWYAVDGIAVAGKKDLFLPLPERGVHKEYCKLRNDAFAMKNDFMSGLPVEKRLFLDEFSLAEKVLEEDYVGYGARAESIAALIQLYEHRNEVRVARRRNASVLINGLQGIEGIRTFLDFKDESKCPLFVPILVEGGKRDALRKHLIDKEIYLPVHWPLSDYHRGISERGRSIYSKELSLVCDQRYREEDMCRIVDEIKEFMSR